MQNTPTPYANLHPDLILTAVESVGYRCSGSLLALNSYENRVYQIGLEDDTFIIAKFYRPARWSNDAILEEHAFAHELAQHEIPIIAPLIDEKGQSLHEYEGYRFALFPRQGGRTIELDNAEHLTWIGRFIGRLHAIGAAHPFKHRGVLNVESHGIKPSQFLLAHDFLPDHLRATYRTTVDEALTLVQHAFQDAEPLQLIRLHGDCHAGNILWRDTGPHLVDLDDSVMGPAMQDIWMLLSGDRTESTQQLVYILDGYGEFHDFNLRELSLAEPLRTLRLMQYAAWLANRWQDPAFPQAFPWFNTPFYWQEHIVQLQNQVQTLRTAEPYPLFLQ